MVDKCLYLWVTAVLFFAADTVLAQLKDQSIPYGILRDDLLESAYNGDERMVYDISWTGGFKIGELHLEIKKTDTNRKKFEIHTLVTTDDGILQYIYPVNDIHITSIYGKARLPFRYEVWQNEGWNYKAHRLTKYRQKNNQIYYWKNKEPRIVYNIQGLIHNEFSSFFVTRVMDLQLERSFIVPTFADHKRNEVIVDVMAKKKLQDTVLGTVNTIEVMPIMKFEGLYDKRGDTVIWFTDDECRVPVKINSKILLGSLTAKLVAWSNPHCFRYERVDRRGKEKIRK